MPKVDEWYSALPPGYKVAFLTIYFAAVLGAGSGLAFGNIRALAAGTLLGVIMGLAYYFRERRTTEFSDENGDDYPEELEQIERRYDKHWLIVAPIFLLIGIVVSWAFFGVGTYGVLGAAIAVVVASWLLGRFGGPSDPKWKSVRDRWERQHGRGGGKE